MFYAAIVGAGVGGRLIARELTKYRQKIKNTGLYPGGLCAMVKCADRQSPGRAYRCSYVLAGHTKEGC